MAPCCHWWLSAVIALILCLATPTLQRESSPPQLPISRDRDGSSSSGTTSTENDFNKKTSSQPEDQGPSNHNPRAQSTGDGEVFGAIDNEESKDRTGFSKNPIFFAVIFVSISLVAIGCGVYMLCKKDNPDAADATGPGYSVAISNRLFKEGAVDKNDLPCLNCRLIEMGEMACYQDTCPQCGNIPPCRKHLYPEANQLVSASQQHQQRQAQVQQQQRRYQTVVSSNKKSNSGLGPGDLTQLPQNMAQSGSVPKLRQEPV